MEHLDEVAVCAWCMGAFMSDTIEKRFGCSFTE